MCRLGGVIHDLNSSTSGDIPIFITVEGNFRFSLQETHYYFQITAFKTLIPIKG